MAIRKIPSKIYEFPNGRIRMSAISDGSRWMLFSSRESIYHPGDFGETTRHAPNKKFRTAKAALAYADMIVDSWREEAKRRTEARRQSSLGFLGR